MSKLSGRTCCADAANKYNIFLAIGIAKLVSHELAQESYTIKDCDAHWLIRDEKTPQRELLHMAFFIGSGPVTKSKRTSSAHFMEKGVIRIVDKAMANRFLVLRENVHKTKLQEKYGKYLKMLREDTFELPIPKPKEE